MCLCVYAFVSMVVVCVCVSVRGQAQIEKVMSLSSRCLQQLGATQPKNEEVKEGDVDKRLG